MGARQCAFLGRGGGGSRDAELPLTGAGELIRAVSCLVAGTQSAFSQQPSISCFLRNSTKSHPVRAFLTTLLSLVVVAAAAETAADVGPVVQGDGAVATCAPGGLSAI